MREYGSHDDRKPSGYAGLAGFGAIVAAGAVALSKRGLHPNTISRITSELYATTQAVQSRASVAGIQAIESIAKGKAGFRESIISQLTESELGKKWAYWSQQFWPTSLIDRLTLMHEARSVGSQAKVSALKDLHIGQDSILKAILGKTSERDVAYVRGKLVNIKTGEVINKASDVYLYSVGKSAEGAAAPTGWLARLMHHMSTETGLPAGASIFEKVRHYLDIGYRGKGVGEEAFWSKGFWKRAGGWLGGFLNDILGGASAREVGVSVGPSKTVGVMQSVSPGNLLKSIFMGGRKRPEDITTATMAPFYMLERMNEALAKGGFPFLAFSERSMHSTFDLYSSIAFKRALPLTALGFYAGYANYAIGEGSGTTPYGAAADTFAQMNLDIADIKDRTGFTQSAKRWFKVFPWTERIVHPFVEQPTALSRGELEEHYKHGEEPVRKGRWWGFILSTSPFRGERISHFQAPWVRRAHQPMREADFWGSEEEYYKHAAFPTPSYPAAPIRHFITEPYALEEKTYKTHPAPMTGPLFEEHTSWGAILNATIGRLLKPQRAMHQGDFKEGIRDVNEQTRVEGAAPGQSGYYGYITPSGAISPSTKRVPPGLVPKEQRKAAKEAGVKYKVVGAGGRSGSRELIVRHNEGIKQASRYKQKVSGRVSSKFLLTPVDVGQEGIPDVESPELLEGLTTSESLSQQASRAYYLGAEKGGIYGWGLASATGYPGSETPIYQHAGRISSFEHYFWDVIQPGGLGGELSEISRRFFPHRSRLREEYNPIPNTNMPMWLPGRDSIDPNYFTDFRTGIPQLKVPAGEYRLPGPIYERVHGFDPMELKLRGSMLGKGSQEMVYHLLGMPADFDPWTEKIMKRGTKVHEILQARMETLGVVYGTEVPIYDKAARISGTVDVIVKQGDKAVPVEIKTVSDERLAQIDKPYRRHMEQLNFYMRTLGAEKGYLYYTSRKDPQKHLVFDINYDPELMEHTMSKVNEARKTVTDMLESGMISRGDLYPAMERLKILADVAPWSAAYKYYRDYLVHSDILTEEEEAEVSRIKRQVTARKKRHEISPYLFKHADIEKRDVTVTRVINANTFMVGEMPGEVLKLAGVKVSTSEDTPEGADYVRQFIHPGAKVTVGYSADDLHLRAADMLSTIRATVWSGDTNINKELIESGLGKEKDEWGPAGVHARFSPFEIAMGSTGERLAHLQIPFVQKFIKTESALESYKRYRVYGQEFQDWSLKTLYQGVLGWGSHGPVFSTAVGAGIGFLLGKTSKGLATTGVQEAAWFTKVGRGKGLGAIAGAALGLASYIVNQVGSDEESAFIPGSRRKERNIEQYFDVIKYMKYRGMYERVSRQIMEEEGFDIQKFIGGLEEEGRRKKELKHELIAEKREILSSKRSQKSREHLESRIEGIDKKLDDLSAMRQRTIAVNRRRIDETKDLRGELKALSVDEGGNAERISTINNRLNSFEVERLRLKDEDERRAADRKALIATKHELQGLKRYDGIKRLKEINERLAVINEDRRVVELTPLDVLALNYKQAYESTLYGADPRGSWSNIFRALPSKEREFFSHFAEAPPEERKEIIRHVPENQRRFLQAKWGATDEFVEQPPELEEFFDEHYLPPADWTGWSSDAPLDAYKLKVIQHQGLDLREAGFWPRQEKMVEHMGTPTLPYDTRMGSRGDVRRRITEVLSGAGLENIRVSIESQPSAINSGYNIAVNVQKNRKDEVRQYLKDNPQEAINV